MWGRSHPCGGELRHDSGSLLWLTAAGFLKEQLSLWLKVSSLQGGALSPKQRCPTVNKPLESETMGRNEGSFTFIIYGLHWSPSQSNAIIGDHRLPAAAAFSPSRAYVCQRVIWVDVNVYASLGDGAEHRAEHRAAFGPFSYHIIIAKYKENVAGFKKF